MNLARRTLLTGLAAVIAAPAIVRASSLMPVKAWKAFAYVADGTHATASSNHWVMEGGSYLVVSTLDIDRVNQWIREHHFDDNALSDITRFDAGRAH